MDQKGWLLEMKTLRNSLIALLARTLLKFDGHAHNDTTPRFFTINKYYSCIFDPKFNSL